jgi:hypothetical protein
VLCQKKNNWNAKDESQNTISPQSVNVSFNPHYNSRHCCHGDQPAQKQVLARDTIRQRPVWCAHQDVVMNQLGAGETREHKQCACRIRNTAHRAVITLATPSHGRSTAGTKLSAAAFLYSPPQPKRKKKETRSQVRVMHAWVTAKKQTVYISRNTSFQNPFVGILVTCSRKFFSACQRALKCMIGSELLSTSWDQIAVKPAYQFVVCDPVKTSACAPVQARLTHLLLPPPPLQ